MDFDIASKLFPNLLTMLVQLLATGVIYFLYKKYLHATVLDFLAARRAKIDADISEASHLKEEALQVKERSEAEYKDLYVEIAELKEKLIADANKEHERLLEASKVEIAQMKAQSEKAIESERHAMVNELYAELLDVATAINKRVLEETEFNEDDMLRALQKEIEQHDYQH